MAEELEKIAFTGELAKSLLSSKQKIQQIVDSVTAIKAQIVTDKAAIQNSEFLDAGEKTQYGAKYTSVIVQGKTDIEAALNA